MPDPFVLLHRGTYYAFGTTGSDRKADGRVFTVLQSTDLVDWQERGGALTPPTPDAAYQYWAPEVAYENGMFFLYYAMGGKEEEKFALRVATSRTPDGPYTDNGTPLLDCERNRFTIDAHPFKDVDGQWYMFYARNFLDTDGGVLPGHRPRRGQARGHDEAGRRMPHRRAGAASVDTLRGETTHERLRQDVRRVAHDRGRVRPPS